MRGRLKRKSCVPVFVVALTFALWHAAALPANAVYPDEILKDAALEKRARAISADLRCLVCQNQSIDDSDAPLAKDLRILVRERLVAGETDEEVRAYIVDRYGDFVLLKPPFNAKTLILWLAPMLILAGGVIAARRLFERTASASGGREAPLSETEAKELDRILGSPNKDA
ncbi:MAG: cytochrome c-type biogenesis protein [Hyphomicrobium sp.]|nr:cytochrome c-type biogenesis protein [Hyphomicrobium sp.]